MMDDCWRNMLFVRYYQKYNYYLVSLGTCTCVYHVIFVLHYIRSRAVYDYVFPRCAGCFYNIQCIIGLVYWYTTRSNHKYFLLSLRGIVIFRQTKLIVLDNPTKPRWSKKAFFFRRTIPQSRWYRQRDRIDIH
jgi:hypothetical protein